MNALNAEKYLREAIDSVYAQTYHNWEIIFWDNASTDHTADIARTYDERLRYFRGEITIPLSRARNYALAEARGKYIAFLDCDDIWLPLKLEKQVELLTACPEVGLVYSNCFVVNASGQPLWIYLTPNRLHKGRVLSHLFLDCFIPCLTAVVRRSVLDQVGLFHPGLNITEDYDLFLRIAEWFEIDFINLPLAKYRLHETNYARDLDQRLKEENIVIEACLMRCPKLRHEIGPRAIRVRKVGLRCSLGHAYLLRGQLAEAKKHFGTSRVPVHQWLQAALLYLISLAGANFIMTARRLYRAIREFVAGEKHALDRSGQRLTRRD